MEIRKVTESQGSFIIRLPIEWATKKELKRGQYIKMEENEMGNLVISKME
jgi:phosphate uptake regulator